MLHPSSGPTNQPSLVSSPDKRTSTAQLRQDLGDCQRGSIVSYCGLCWLVQKTSPTLLFSLYRCYHCRNPSHVRLGGDSPTKHPRYLTPGQNQCHTRLRSRIQRYRTPAGYLL
jgi:hypothetical protein